jgi:arylsulfatase
MSDPYWFDYPQSWIGGPHLGALRLDDFKSQFFQQPYPWPGEKITTDMPSIVNLRQEPFANVRSGLSGGY